MLTVHVFVFSHCFFFFYCSGDPRDLHSFPTRRSSDLVGPFDSLAFPFVDEEDKPRLLTVVHGGGGVGKTSLLQALSSARPGHCVAHLRQREARLDEEAAEPATPRVVCHWWLGQDDPSRPHPLILASPNARVFPGEQEE